MQFTKELWQMPYLNPLLEMYKSRTYIFRNLFSPPQKRENIFYIIILTKICVCVGLSEALAESNDALDK